MLIFRFMYFPQIDSFRFIAVFLVLVSHWMHDVAYVNALYLGPMGVEFFFAISGFLISLQLYDYYEKVNANRVSAARTLKTFFARRVLRIFPLYYFVLFILTALGIGTMREAFWWNVTYLSNFYFISTAQWAPAFSHFWSLSVEEHFYLAWPLLLIFVHRRWWPVLFLSLILCSVGFRYYYFNRSPGYFFYTFCHTIACLGMFMMGAIVAYCYKYQRAFFDRLFKPGLARYLMPVLFLALIAFWMLYPDPEAFNAIYRRFFLGFFYAYLIGVLVFGVRGIFGKLYDHSLLIRLGKLSYGIYLVHNFVPILLQDLLSEYELRLWILFIIYFILTVGVSYLLYLFVEQPIRRWNRYFTLD